MRKWLIIVGIVAIGFIGVSIWYIQANSVGTLCEQYENDRDIGCKEVFTDWQHQIAFIKTNNGIAFLQIDPNGKWLPAASILSFSDLQSNPIDWVATTDQNKSFVAGIATKDVKQVKLANPVPYYPNVIFLEDYSIFYIPLEEQSHYYGLNLQGYNDQGELIYGKPEDRWYH
nr:hypothetical protein [Lysinibacillus timonensis]